MQLGQATRLIDDFWTTSIPGELVDYDRTDVGDAPGMTADAAVAAVTAAYKACFAQESVLRVRMPACIAWLRRTAVPRATSGAGSTMWTARAQACGRGAVASTTNAVAQLAAAITKMVG